MEIYKEKGMFLKLYDLTELFTLHRCSNGYNSCFCEESHCDKVYYNYSYGGIFPQNNRKIKIERM